MYASPAAFWTAFSLVAASLLVFVIIFTCTTHTSSVIFFRIARILVWVVGTFMFVPFLTAFLAAAGCEVGFPYGHANRGACWDSVPGYTSGGMYIPITGYDRVVSLLGVLTLFVFLAIAVISHGFLYENNPIARNAIHFAQPQGRTALLSMGIKTFFVILFRFIAPHMHARVTAAIVAATLCGNFWLYLRYLPWYSFFMAQVYTSLYALTAWAGICAFVSALVGNPEDMGTAVIFYVTAPLVLYCGILAARARRLYIEQFPAYQFRSCFDAELKARFFLEPITKRATNPHASEAEVLLPEHQPYFTCVDEWFTTAMKYHPNSVTIHILYAQFVLFYLRDTKASQTLLSKAAALHPNLDDQFQIFRLQQLTRHIYEEDQYEEQRNRALALRSRREGAAKSGESSMGSALLRASQRKRHRDLAINLALEKHTADALHVEELGTRAQILFWLELQKATPEFGVLTDLAHEITKYAERANYHAYKVLKMRKILRKSVAVEEQLQSSAVYETEAGATMNQEVPESAAYPHHEQEAYDMDAVPWFEQQSVGNALDTMSEISIPTSQSTAMTEFTTADRTGPIHSLMYGNAALLNAGRRGSLKVSDGSSRPRRMSLAFTKIGPVGTLLITMGKKGFDNSMAFRNTVQRSSTSVASILIAQPPAAGSAGSGRTSGGLGHDTASSAASLLSLLSEHFRVDNGDLSSLATAAAQAYSKSQHDRSPESSTRGAAEGLDFSTLFQIEEVDQGFQSLFGYSKAELTGIDGGKGDIVSAFGASHKQKATVSLPNLFPEPFKQDQVELMKKFVIATIASLSEMHSRLTSTSSNQTADAVVDLNGTGESAIPFEERLLYVYSHIYLLAQHADGSVFPCIFSARPVRHPSSPAALMFSFESVKLTNRHHYILARANGTIVSCTPHTLSLFEPETARILAETPGNQLRNAITRFLSDRLVEDWLPGYTKVQQGYFSTNGMPFVIALKRKGDTKGSASDPAQKLLLVRICVAPAANRLPVPLVPMNERPLTIARPPRNSIEAKEPRGSQLISRIAARNTSLPSLPSVVSNPPRGANESYMGPDSLLVAQGQTSHAQASSSQAGRASMSSLAPHGSLASLSAALAPALAHTELRNVNLYAAPCELATPQDPDSLFKLASRVVRAKQLDVSRRLVAEATGRGSDNGPNISVQDLLGDKRSLNADDLSVLMPRHADETPVVIYFEILRVMSFDPTKARASAKQSVHENVADPVLGLADDDFAEEGFEDEDEDEDEDDEAIINGVGHIILRKSTSESGEAERIEIQHPPYPGSFATLDSPIEEEEKGKAVATPRPRDSVRFHHDPSDLGQHDDDANISGFALFEPQSQIGLTILQSASKVKKAPQRRRTKPTPNNQELVSVGGSSASSTSAVAPAIFHGDRLDHYEQRLLAVIETENAMGLLPTSELMKAVQAGFTKGKGKLSLPREATSPEVAAVRDLISHGFSLEDFDEILDQELPRYHSYARMEIKDVRGNLASDPTYALKTAEREHMNRYYAFDRLWLGSSGPRRSGIGNTASSLYASGVPEPMHSSGDATGGRKSLGWHSTVSGSRDPAGSHAADLPGNKMSDMANTETDHDVDHDDDDDAWIFGDDDHFNTSTDARFDRLVRWRDHQSKHEARRRQQAIEAKQRLIDRLNKASKAMERDGVNTPASNAVNVIKSMDESTSDLTKNLRAHIAAENRQSQKTTRKFQIAFVTTITLAVLLGLAQFVSQYVQVNQFYDNLKIVEAATARADAVVRGGYAAQYLSAIRAGWSPPAIYEGWEQPTFSMIQKNLYSLAAILSDSQGRIASAKRRSSNAEYEAQDISIYDVNVGGFVATPFATAVSNFVSRMKDISALSQAAVTPSHTSVGYVLANTSGALLTALIESSRRLANDIQYLVTESNIWAIVLLVVAFAVLALLLVFVIRPFNIAINQNRAKILSILTGIPHGSLKRIHALAALRLAVIVGDVYAIKDAKAQLMAASKRDITDQLPTVAHSDAGTAVSAIPGARPMQEEFETHVKADFSFMFKVRMSGIFIVSAVYYLCTYFALYAPVKEYMAGSATTAYYHSLQSVYASQVFFDISTLYSNDPSTEPPNLVTIDEARDHLQMLIDARDALINDGSKFNGLSLYEATSKLKISHDLRDLWFGETCSLVFPSENPVATQPTTVYDEYGTASLVGPFRFQDYFAVPYSACHNYDTGSVATGLQTALQEFVRQAKLYLDTYNPPSPPAAFPDNWVFTDNYWRYLQAMQLKSVEYYVESVGDHVHKFKVMSIIAFSVYAGVALLMYIFLYHPLIVGVHAKLKAIRAVLFLVPTEILANVQVFRQWLRSKHKKETTATTVAMN